MSVTRQLRCLVLASLLVGTSALAGNQRTNIAGNDVGRALVVQPDGKLVVAGSSSNNFAVIRYQAGGILDPEFSHGGVDGDGILRFNISGNDSANALAIQRDAKIILAGVSSDDFAVARLKPDGTLDNSFSPGGLDGDGVLRFNISGNDSVNAIAIQPGGKIILAGVSSNDFAVARLNPDGTLDNSFSPGELDGDGVLRFNISGTDSANAVAIQPDGKIILAGGSSNDFAVARLKPDGTLDSSFSPGGLDGDGVLRFNISGNDSVNAIAIQPDGKIILAGVSSDDFAVARLKPDGTLDSSFSPGGLDGDGVLRFNISGNDSVNAIAIQPDGKIILAGVSSDDFAVARLKPDGALDSSFSPGGLDGDGVLRFNISGTDSANAVAIVAQGNIVLAGVAAEDFAASRLKPNGTADPTFPGSTNPPPPPRNLREELPSPSRQPSPK